MNICSRQFTVIGAAKYQNKMGVVDDFRRAPRNMNSFCLILTGSGKFINKEKTFIAKPGDIVFSPIGTKYKLEWTGNPDSSILSLHFTFPPRGNPYESICPQQLVNATPELVRDICFIVDNFGDEKRSLLVLSKFYGIVDEIFKCLIPDELSDTSSEIRKAMQFIDENCCRKLTIREIAACCGLSRSYFQHQFKAETGITPIEYKNRAAISIAERHLSEDSRLTIEKVSELTGFESTAYFRKVFKKITKYNPSEYKKMRHGVEPSDRY